MGDSHPESRSGRITTIKKPRGGASLAATGLDAMLPLQQAQAQPLVRELAPTCCVLCPKKKKETKKSLKAFLSIQPKNALFSPNAPNIY